MGFFELSIGEIAQEYQLSLKTVFHLCQQLGISYQNENTCLALEDAKAIITQILSQQNLDTEIW